MIKGTLKREITGWGSCILCGTLGLVSFGISKSWEQEDGEEIYKMLNYSLEEITTELRNEGKIEKPNETNNDKSALEKLKEKFVEGEISEKEFKRKKEILED